MVALALGLVAASTLASRAASAQRLGRTEFRADLGGGTTLHDHYAADVGLNTPMAVGHILFGLHLTEGLSIQGGGGWGRFFFADQDDTTYFDAVAGLRLGSFSGTVHPWIDVNGGGFITDNTMHPGVLGGLGVEFAINDTTSIGPFGRFAYVFNGYTAPTLVNPSMPSSPASDTPTPRDISYWTAGLSVTVRPPDAPPPPPPPPPPRDTDSDGVNDPDDQCVSEPAGQHPDPARRGCPAADTDSDGVFDPDDQCVNEAAGEHPDAARPGCPLADDDHDGVYGSDDQCPTEPAGAHPNPERAGCPDGDEDHDGVFDHADQCRTEPVGLHPDPARAGCPAPDRDHDNVPDATDHCPDRPGAPSPNPARNGCPGLVLVTDGQVRINRPVFFGNNSDAVLPTSTPVLRAVADALAATPEIRQVSVEGHTDDVGDDARNLDLSRRRAASVVRWLTTTGRIDAARLVSDGFGETRPLAQGTTPAVRAQNRRVEFRIVAFGEAPAAAPAAAPATAPATP